MTTPVITRAAVLGATALRGGRRRATPYLVCGALFWLVMSLAYWRTPVCCDAGQHAAVIERLRASLTHPAHPSIDASGAGSPYYSPFALAQGLLARATWLDGWAVERLTGPLNLAVLLAGVGRFARRLSPRPWAPVAVLAALMLLWGTEAVWWSGFLSLLSATVLLSYPSTLAMGLAFWAWAWTWSLAEGRGAPARARGDGAVGLAGGAHGTAPARARADGAGRARERRDASPPGRDDVRAPLGQASPRSAARIRARSTRAWPFAGLGLLLAVILLVHPITALGTSIGLVAIVAGRQRAWAPRDVARWGSAAVAAGAVALCWPYFDVFTLIGDDSVDGGHERLYAALPGAFWLALLGLPALGLRLRRDRRDPLVLLCAASCALVLYGWVSGHTTYGRMIAFVLVPLQCALAVECVAPRPWRAPRRLLGCCALLGALTGLVAQAAAAVLPADRGSAAVRPLDWPSYDWAARHMRRGDVVLAAGYRAKRVLPGYGVDLVAPTWPDPALGERLRERRLAAVRGYLARDSTPARRAAVVRRYRVDWLLLDPSDRMPREAVAVAWSPRTGEVLARVR